MFLPDYNSKSLRYGQEFKKGIQELIEDSEGLGAKQIAKKRLTARSSDNNNEEDEDDDQDDDHDDDDHDDDDHDDDDHDDDQDDDDIATVDGNDEDGGDRGPANKSCDDSKDVDNRCSSEEWNMLGLRIFKVKNDDEIVNNILCRPPPKPIQLAEFDSSHRTQILYLYSLNVQSNNTRAVDDIKQVEKWESSMIPPRPVDTTKGFLPGEAEKWFRKVYGDDHKLVLSRVLQKVRDPNLLRPNIEEYLCRDSLLDSDKQLVDSLPMEDFFTSIGCSNNAGK
jgi:hypothetical protein